MGIIHHYSIVFIRNGDCVGGILVIFRYEKDFAIKMNTGENIKICKRISLQMTNEKFFTNKNV